QDFLGHHTDRALGVARMGVDVEAPDARGPAGLHDEAGEDVDQRGLAGAVRAEQAENAAAGNVEADPVQRALAALVGLLQIADRDRRFAHRLRHSPSFPSGEAQSPSLRQGSWPPPTPMNPKSPIPRAPASPA